MAKGFVHPEYLVETDWLADHLDDPGVRVLDCSTHLPPLPDNSYYTINALRPEQHAGTGGVYYGRRGHIKGSVNLAAVGTVDGNNVYKSADELRRMFAEPLSKPAVITYCGGGIAATADTLVLTMLGHNNVKLYDASLSEWARDPALPMAI